MSRLAANLLVIAAGLAAATPAAAAPFTVGAGEHPRVAVDAAGTAYVVWTEIVPNGPAPGNDITHFCKVPRGASGCATGSERVFAPDPGPGSDDDSGSGPAVFLNGANVTVWLDRTDSSTVQSITYAAVSANGGTTFTAPTVIGAQGAFSSGDVIALPSSAIAAVDAIHTGGNHFQRQPLAGPAPTSSMTAAIGDNGESEDFAGQSALASFGTAAQDRLLAVIAQVGGSENLGFRTYAGTGDNANTLANWSAPAVLGPGFSPRLCPGAGGIALVSFTGPVAGSYQLQRRRYDPATNRFSAPATIATSNISSREGCAQDPAGNLIVVYTDQGSQRLWSSARPDETAELNAEEPSPASSVAVAPDGGGWVAYGSPDGVNGIVRLQPLSDATYTTGATTPVRGQVLAVGKVSGTVKVRVKGSRRFTTLSAGRGIPPGSEIDATKGTVAIASAKDAKRNVQSAQFRLGRFVVAQTRRSALTTATLTGAPSKCARAGRASSSARARAKRRRLFGSGKGSFRTIGHYGSATIRGTRWLVEDLCDRTKITSLEGAVDVRDLVKRKTVRLKKGQSYTARARG